MAFHHYRPVWDAELSSTTKLVLLRLVDYAAEDGSQIYPSIGTVAKACGITTRAVRHAVAYLRGVGVLVLTREEDPSAKRPREYCLDLEKINALKPVNPGTTFTPEPASPLNVVPAPLNVIPRTPERSSAKETKEHTKENTRGAVALFPINLTTYQPSPKTIEWAKFHAPGIDIPRELELWRTRNANPRAGRTKPPVIRDFDASFRNALLKALEFAKQDGRIKVATQSPDDFLRRNGVEI